MKIENNTLIFVREMNSETKVYTIGQLRQKHGKTPAAFRMFLKSKFGLRYSESGELTPSQIEQIESALASLRGGRKSDNAPAAKKAAALVQVAPVSRPQQTARPSQAALQAPQSNGVAFYAPLLVTVVSVCLTIGGLYRFADLAGGALGGMFGLYLLSSVWVAKDRHKGDTSTRALNTVFWLEMAASVLHFFTFASLLPRFSAFGWEYGNLVLSGLCASAVAYLSYEAVILVRNYNAEV